MSSSIDQRIVDMQFNNKQFESGIKTSTDSIDKLKKGLNFTGATKGLENLQRSFSSFTLAGIANGVNALTDRFSNMGVVGMTVIQNLTNQAVNAGKRIASAITIEPLKTGFSEYETKMGSIQTILTNTQSKGTTLDQVNTALNDLNEYSDKTIYNFSEMARNIGTFTAAGVDLNTSVTAIKGIANLAAGSGSTSQQASTAMYQLSQALAAGKVSLMDWNSVVNAGMGGELFKSNLIKTAKAMGKVTTETVNGQEMIVSYNKEGEKSVKTFRESLESGWLTSDILTKTLTQFANDQSLVDAATKVKTATQLMGTLKESMQSGWAQSWETIVGNKDEATALWTGVNDALGGMIAKAAESRNAMFKTWKELGGRTSIITSLSNAFNGLLLVLKPIKEAFHNLFPSMTGEKLAALSQRLERFSYKLSISDETAAKIYNTFRGLFSVLAIGKQAFIALAGGIEKLWNKLAPAGNSLLTMTSNLGLWLVGLNDAIFYSGLFEKAIDALFLVLKPIKDAFTNIFPKIVPSGMMDWLTNITKSVEGFANRLSISDETAGRIYNTFRGLFAIVDIGIQAFTAIAKGVGSLLKYLFPAGDGLLTMTANLGLWLVGLDEAIKKAGGFTYALDAVHTAMKNVIKFISDKANSIDVSWIKDLNVNLPPLEKIAKVIGAVFAKMGELISNALGGINFESIMKLLNGGLFAAILFGIKKLVGSLTGMIENNNILEKVTGILDGVRSSLETFQASLKAKALMLIAVAIGILAGSLLVLSLIDSGKLIPSLAALSVIFAELMGAMMLFDKFSPASSIIKLSVTMFAMIALATAVLILAAAMKKLSSIEWEGIMKGLVGVGVLMAEMVLFLNNAKFGKKAVSTAVGLLILALSLKLLASVMWDFAQMDWGIIGKGLITIGLLLAELALFTKAINTKGLFVAGAAMILISTALTLLSVALLAFGLMPVSVIYQGLIVMGIALAELAIGLNLMTGTLAGSAALLVASVAFGILASSLALMGLVSWESILKGLVGLAGVLVIFGIAAGLLAPVVPVMLALGGAIALMGLGVLALGAGLVLLSIGLTAFATTLAVSSAIIITTITGILTAIVGLIPMVIQKIGEGIILFCDTLLASAGIIAQTVIMLITTVVTALIQVIPLVVEAVFLLLNTILDALVTQTPVIVQKLINILIGFLEAIAENTPKIVNAVVDLVLAMVEAITEKIPVMVDAGFKMIIGFLDGLTKAINDNKTKLADSIRKLIEAMISAAVEVLGGAVGGFTKAGGAVVEGFITGLRSKIQAAANWAGSLASTVITAAKRVFGIASPSKVFAEMGAYSGQGFINGMRSYQSKVADSATTMGQGALSAMSKAIAGIQSAIDTDLDSTPVIKPVLDLTNIQNGSGQLQGLMNGYAMSGNIQVANNIAKATSENAASKNAPGEKTGLTLVIENFNNTRSQDIQSLAEELAFYMKQQTLGLGVS